jgi:cyclophilin family peptidyl-prolyl cis-trans isomerase
MDMRRSTSRPANGPSHSRHRPLFDALERRTMFASPTLAALPNVTVLSGAPLQVPLDGFDADAADALTFTVTSSNANVVPTISPATNRSLRITVNHASSGAAGDVAIANESMVIKLFEDKAPRTTARIIELANSGFYNNKIFHRVIDNFMIQGGDPLGNGTGGSGVDFDDEFDPSLQFTGRGLLAMANSGDDTNDSQFFITESNPRHLDFDHTIFGQLVEGEATREKISNLPTDANDRPLSPVTTTSVTVIPDRQNGVLSLAVPNGVTSGTATVTVTARDPAGNSTSRTFTVTIAPDANDNKPFLLPIAPVTIGANSSKTITIPSTDVDGGAQTFGKAADPHPDVRYTLAGNQLTVTTANGIAGVAPLVVGVRSATSQFDTQVVPVFINPAAPTSIDLLDVSDTGVSTTDNLTRLNNANAAAKLQFRVGGVLPGALVTLKEGNTVLGTAVVPAGQDYVEVTTNGAASLANGQRNVVATQTLADYAWAVGNQSGTTDLVSASSPAFALQVDAAAPALVGAPAFDWRSAAQSIRYTFNEDVSASLAAGDLVVTPVPGTAPIPAANLKVMWNAATKTAVFTFQNYPNGTLPDGNYTFQLPAANVTDNAGNAVTTAPTVTFFSYGGDADHDGTVDFNDLVKLAQNYDVLTGRTWEDGDFTGDGAVDFNDLVILAQRYDSTLAADGVPAPVPAPAPLAASPASFADAWASAQVAPVTREAPKSLFSTSPVAKPVKPKPVSRPARR